MLISRLPHIISFALLLAIAGLMYLQLNEFIFPSQQKTTPSNIQQSISTPTAQPTKNFNIAAFNLFGKAGAVQSNTDAIPEKLPETKLKLTLRGVLAGQGNNINGALIEGPDRDTSYYRVGDQLPGNATLNRVFEDRIIIQRSGKLENLYFLDTFSSTNSITAIYDDNEQADESTTQQQPVATRPIQNFDNARKQSIKDRLAKLRKKIGNKNN